MSRDKAIVGAAACTDDPRAIQRHQIGDVATTQSGRKGARLRMRAARQRGCERCGRQQGEDELLHDVPPLGLGKPAQSFAHLEIDLCVRAHKPDCRSPTRESLCQGAAIKVPKARTTKGENMNPAPARARLGAILAGDACIRPVSVFDPISARIAESIGFEAGMYAGSVSSLVVLGAPDIILLTLTEFAAQARRICRASQIPLICDADHGYGNALNVMRTIEELEAAGVAGLTVEDTDLPRPFGAAKARPISLKEGVGKVKAALAARSDPVLKVFARTGALAMTGLDDMLERLRAYQDTGCDGVFLTGAKSKPEIEAIAKTARVPILLGAIGKDIDDTAFLGDHGVRIALMGHQPFMAAVEAIRQTMQAQRDGKSLPALASGATMAAVTREADYAAWTAEYLD